MPEVLLRNTRKLRRRARWFHRSAAPRPAALALSVLMIATALLAQAPGPKLTKADIDNMMKELSNWGRWGKDDQKGTANLITPAKRKQAAALVTEGISISLARNTDPVKGVDNSSPFIEKMSPPADGQFNMDEFTVFFHGVAHTHFDALSHMFHDGQMYNGFPESAVKSDGAGALAVTAYSEGLFTRGVLVDIAWLRGVPYLEPSAVVFPADFDAWETNTGVHIQPGDAVFVRTGRWAYRAAKGPWDIGSHAAGLSALCARWLHRHDVAVLGSDSSHDAAPSGIPDVSYPVHLLLIVAMGMPLFDQCDLEALSKAAAARHRWTFLFTAAPVRVTGGTGGPVNPIATF
jgi:kynurenine formamidase